MSKYCSELSKVFDQFVLSLEDKSDLSFWDAIASEIAGSGSSALAGWITVFACF